jgi:predicted N-acetyltransferase YhbS
MLRQEVFEDHREVETLVYEAFESSSLYEFKEPVEHKLVAQLRNSVYFVPELSIVVQEGWEIVGHALSTAIDFAEGDRIKRILALAPMSVKPVLQQTGVGLQLIMETSDVARKLGYGAIVVLGHEDYYPRRGFRKAKDLNITCNIEGVENNLFVMELEKGFFDETGGKVVYPDIFFKDFS